MEEKYKTLIQILENTPEVISNYILSISKEDLEQKRGEKFWSVKEHLIHLDATQDLLYSRILMFKNEEKPIITPYFPENDKIDVIKFNSIDDVLDSFKKKRNEQISLVNQLDESSFKKEATHGEYKKYNLEIILNHMLFHDYWHMYRIEELWLTKDKYLTKLV
jgi:uncharacterized damage-inducible protein DinB